MLKSDFADCTVLYLWYRLWDQAELGICLYDGVCPGRELSTGWHHSFGRRELDHSSLFILLPSNLQALVLVLLNWLRSHGHLHDSYLFLDSRVAKILSHVASIH